MDIVKTPLKDVIVLKPKVFLDDRGYFFESFSQNFFKDICNTNFVQDNE